MRQTLENCKLLNLISAVPIFLFVSKITSGSISAAYAQALKSAPPPPSGTLDRNLQISSERDRGSNRLGVVEKGKAEPILLGSVQ
jgi:hypothetical protein